MQKRSEELGLKPIPKLLFQQAAPASIGILVMSIYMIVDSIFVGRFVGAMGLAAVAVVSPIIFLIASIGMAIGIGGGSVISRALGAKNPEKANHAFGNQAVLVLGLSILISVIAFVFIEPVLSVFGAKNRITEPAIAYFSILLPSIPFLAWAMMSNNVIRAEGKPRMAMVVLLIPAIANIILDPILIAGFGMGIEGAAWATAASYFASAVYTLWYFSSGRSELKLKLENMQPDPQLVQEIFGIGFVTLARQGAISLLAIVLNNSLVHYGSENSVAVFGLITAVLRFANFPVLGLMQGFLPI
ncbi:MAG: MATE family efflux transporter, partial [Bacteroidota bacterium]